MSRRILILQGHPDSSRAHLGYALADAYAAAAEAAGHLVRRVEVSRLEISFLESQHAWKDQAVPASLAEAQQAIAWAEHITFFFPLWMGTMPARLHAFLEQVLRPGFALEYGPDGMPHSRLRGRSARLVVTMGMPAFAYRWIFAAHGVRGFERSILKLCGIKPVKETLLGGVESASDGVRKAWFDLVATLGRRGV